MASLSEKRALELRKMVYDTVKAFNNAGIIPTSKMVWRVINENRPCWHMTVASHLNRLCEQNEVLYYQAYYGEEYEKCYMTFWYARENDWQTLGKAEVANKYQPKLI